MRRCPDLLGQGRAVRPVPQVRLRHLQGQLPRPEKCQLALANFQKDRLTAEVDGHHARLHSRHALAGYGVGMATGRQRAGGQSRRGKEAPCARKPHDRTGACRGKGQGDWGGHQIITGRRRRAELSAHGGRAGPASCNAMRAQLNRERSAPHQQAELSGYEGHPAPGRASAFWRGPRRGRIRNAKRVLPFGKRKSGDPLSTGMARLTVDKGKSTSQSLKSERREEGS